MSSKLKLILIGLFLVQIGIFAWSYFGKQQEDKQYYQAIGQYLENPDNVKILDLSGLDLKKIPKEITQFQNLESLNLSNNRFKEIPYDIYDFESLKNIDLSYNRIKEIEFYNNNSIESINLSHNRIEYIDYSPCSVGCLHNLRTINFSHNNLDECPTFNNSSSVDTILISNNQLNSFYNLHMSLPKNIGYLDVSSNEIEGIDEDLYEFIGFNYYDLITLLNKCESINLSNNFFEYFPYEIFRSEKLSKLTMQNCDYKVIDNEIPSIGRISNIRYLDLSNTEKILDNVIFSDFEDLENLNLENTFFNTFILNHPYLKKLNIKNIEVKEVDAFFEIRCPNLEHLEIDYSTITTFTDEDLIQMPNLKTIVIANYQKDIDLIGRLKLLYMNIDIILE